MTDQELSGVAAPEPRQISHGDILSLARSKQIPMDSNPATQHMFIIKPFSSAFFTNLYSTHPPMEERIAHLEALRSGR